MPSNLCTPLTAVSTALRRSHNVQKGIVEKKKKKKTEAKDCPTLYDSPAPPPSTSSLLDAQMIVQLSASLHFISSGRSDDCPALCESPALPPSTSSLLDAQMIVQLSASLHFISSGRSDDCPALCESPALPPSTSSLLDAQMIVQLSVRVQLCLPPLHLFWTLR